MADARERPIIFSAPMVRAILDGRKTQTRRVLKLPTKTHSGGLIYERPDMGGWEATTVGGGGCFRIGRSGERIPVPEEPAIWHRTTGTCMAMPWKVGDRAWVRETWASINDRMWRPEDVIYRADDGNKDWAHGWRSPIHMPRWASRITLLIENVRVQPLQDISEEDARAEGVDPTLEPPDGGSAPHIAGFRELWTGIHGPDAWDRNEWVSALSFRRIAGDHHG